MNLKLNRLHSDRGGHKLYAAENDDPPSEIGVPDLYITGMDGLKGDDDPWLLIQADEIVLHPYVDSLAARMAVRLPDGTQAEITVTAGVAAAAARIWGAGMRVRCRELPKGLCVDFGE